MQGEPSAIVDLDLHLFEPDGARAALINSNLAAKLSQSLGALTAASRAHYGFPGDEAEATCAAVAAASVVDPLVFATYFDLIKAAQDGDGPALQGLWRRLARLETQAAPFHPVRWGDPHMPAERADALLRAANADPSTPVAPSPLDPAAFAAACRSLDRVMTLFREAAPELEGEITALVRDLVLTDCAVEGGTAFDGVTSFHCTGALFLNAADHHSVAAMADGLSHESAHAYLFGAGLGAPFVQNGLDQRFDSPLRQDPRPLEGIYHAAFVSARRCFALRRLLASGLLTREEAQEADGLHDGARDAFFSGLATLDAQAALTEPGRCIMDGARRYMGAGASKEFSMTHLHKID